MRKKVNQNETKKDVQVATYQNHNRIYTPVSILCVQEVVTHFI